MKCWQGCLILPFLVVGTVGCKTPGSTEALQRELRYQEDMIYQLQDYIRTYKCYLEECRQENEACRQHAKPSGQGPSILKHEEHPDVQLTPPGGQFPQNNTIQPPKIELPGTGKGAQSQFPSHPLATHQSEPFYTTQAISTQWGATLPKDITLARYQESILRDPSVPTPLGVGQVIQDATIMNLPFGEGYAGGYTEEGKFGGVWLLLSPRNASGQKVRPSGELSIALINPRAYSANTARLASWKFSPSQVELITEDLPVGESLLLELPWSGEPPLDSLLKVYVRLITPEGNQLIVDERVDLALKEPFVTGDPSENGRGWRKRTRPRDFPTPKALGVSKKRQVSLSRRDFIDQRAATSRQTPKPIQTQPRVEWKPYR